MTLRCPACQAYVDEKNRATAGKVRCERCGMRFSAPKSDPPHATREADPELGIHPALARRYRDQQVKDETGERKKPDLAENRVVDGPPPGLTLSEPPAKHGTIELSPSLVDEAKVPPREERTRALGPGRQKKNDDGADEKGNEDALPEIPGYVLLGVVGKGAMGRVYRAREERTGRLVAMKTLAPELAARADFVARFEREAAALKAVKHEGVVSITDRGTHGEHHYICMPYVEGDSLRRALAQGALYPLRALAFSRQIVQALAAAHDKKVIHRDLKPENILVTALVGPPPTEKLMLVDFGLAGMGEDDPHPNLTKSRMTMGTVNYMAPEQRTDAKRVGPAADLYAAGVIFYELLTGDLPLGRFKMPTERPGLTHLPAAIDECLARALDRDPERRYRKAQDFDADLAFIERELTVQVSRDTVVGRAEKMPPSSGAPTEVASAPPVSSSIDTEPSSQKKEDDVEEALSESALESIEDGTDEIERRPRPRTFGPQWITSPPWVRNPQVIWGALAIALGAGIGLVVVPGLEKAPSAGFPVTAGFAQDGLRVTSVATTDDDAPRSIFRPPSRLTTTIRAAVKSLEGESVGGVIGRVGGKTVGATVFHDGRCGKLEAGEMRAVPGCHAALPASVTLECAAGPKSSTCHAVVGEHDWTMIIEGGDAQNLESGLMCRGPECVFDVVSPVRDAT